MTVTYEVRELKAELEATADYIERRALRQQERREMFASLRSNIKLASGCVDCPPGTPWPACALDFDHVRGVKLFNLAQVGNRSLDTFVTEVDKCEVVCANHHRMRTEARQ